MKIFLAGCEGIEPYQAASIAGIKNILFSYYHLQKKSSTAKEIMSLMNKRDQEVICDSGLFTMMFGAGKGKTYTYSDLLDYTKKYIETAKGFGVKNLTIVEMDTHKILELPKLYEFRKHFEDSGIQTLYVWHVEEKIEGLFRMAEKYNYIALSVPELRILCKGKKTRYQDVVHDLLYKIQKNVGRLPKIHLLGNTVPETMETNTAYSCDSSSWTFGVRHSRTYFYINGKVHCKYLGRKSDDKWHELFKKETQAIAEANPEMQDYMIGKSEKQRDYFLQLVYSANSFQKYQMKLNSQKPYEVPHEKKLQHPRAADRSDQAQPLES